MIVLIAPVHGSVSTVTRGAVRLEDVQAARSWRSNSAFQRGSPGVKVCCRALGRTENMSQMPMNRSTCFGR